MGLDTAEMLMDIEDTFGIDLEDDGLSRIRTVGELEALVWDRSRGKKAAAHKLGPKADTCPSFFVCFRLRRAFMSLFGIPRKRFRLNTPMNALIRKPDRMQDWQRLGKELGWELPALRHPLERFWGDWLFVFAALALMILCASHYEIYMVALLLGSALYYALYCLLLSRNQDMEFTPDCATVRGTVYSVLAMNHEKIAAVTGKTDRGATSGEARAITKEDIRLNVRRIISNVTDIPHHRINDKDRFVEDLGMD